MNSKFSKCEGGIFHVPLRFVLLLSLLKLSIAQSTAPTSSYPPDIFHEIVDMGTLTNPTTAGQTTITTVTRPHSANVVYLGNPKIGIAGMEFTPTSSLNYRVEWSTTTTILTLKLTLVYPTTFVKLFISCVTQKYSAGIYTYFSTISLGTSTQSLPYTWATTTGLRERVLGYTTSDTSVRHNHKCIVTILGFVGTSISDYEFASECYLTFTSSTVNSYIHHKQWLFGNTLGTKFYSQILLWNKYLTKVKSVHYLYSDQLLIENGAITNGGPIPTFDPAVTVGFLSLNRITMSSNQLFKFNFDFASGFSLFPLTTKNIFDYSIFTKKSCTAPSQLNRVTFQCVPNLINTCSPQYVDLPTNETIQAKKITDVIMSRTNKYLAMCLIDKVVIFRWSGTDYAKQQTIFLPTTCESIHTSVDFSILAIAGSNFFQIYTLNANGSYVNFFSYSVEIGLLSANKRVSVSNDGLKIVVMATITAGTFTANGHYLFVYNKTLGTYTYKSFEASAAIAAYFSPDGNSLYIIKQNKIVVYEQKSNLTLCNYIISYVLDTVDGQSDAYSSGWGAMSGDGKTIAVHLSYKGIKIYQFNEITRKFVYHSIVEEIYMGSTSFTRIKIDGNGLVMVTNVGYENGIFVYKRNSLADQFVLKTILGEGLQTGTLSQGSGLAVSYDGQVQMVSKTAYLLSIYSCGASVVDLTEPPIGSNVINQAYIAFQQTVVIEQQNSANSTNNSTTNNTTNNTNLNNNTNNNTNNLVNPIDGVQGLKQKISNLQNTQIAIVVILGVLLVGVVALVVLVKKSLTAGGSAALAPQSLPQAQYSLPPGKQSLSTQPNQLNESNANMNDSIMYHEEKQTLNLTQRATIAMNPLSILVPSKPGLNPSSQNANSLTFTEESLIEPKDSEILNNNRQNDSIQKKSEIKKKRRKDLYDTKNNHLMMEKNGPDDVYDSWAQDL